MNLNSMVYLFSAVAPVIMLALFYTLTPKNACILSALIFLLGILGGSYLQVPRIILFASFFVSILNASGIALFILMFNRFQLKQLENWVRQRKDSETRFLDAANKRKEYKSDLERSERETVRTLRLYAAIKGIGESLSWEEMVPHIDYAVQQYLGFQEYQLFLLDEGSNFQKMISHGIRLAEAPLQSPALKPMMHRKGNEIYLEDPIRHGDTQIGMLWIRMAPAKSGIQENVLLRDAHDLSEELAMGLQKARLFSSIEKLSRIDGLTGVYRRQVFNERLNEEIRRARAFRSVFSVMIGDIDHFKRVNDTYGHQAGDEVLRRIGEILRESVYETDFVARYGGEEFVILFPQADPAGVLRKAELLRNKILQETFQLGLNAIRLTISLGIAHFPKDGTDPSSLLNLADQSLYTAKKWGRNQVVDSSQLQKQSEG